MRMKLWVTLAVAALGMILTATPASADSATFDLTSNNCSGGVGLCVPGPYGTITLTLVGSTIHVDVSMNPGFGLVGTQDAFGFNVVNPDTTITISNISAGFSLGSSGRLNGYGDFEFRIDGPSPSSPLSSLSFDVSRSSPGTAFTSVSQLEELSSGTAGDGNVLFAAHVAAFGPACPAGTTGNCFTGFSGSGNTPLPPPVPEPGTLALFGSGLLGLAAVIRRRMGG